LIDNWLRSIQDTYRCHQAKVDALENPKDRHNALCELNVVGQVANVCHTTIVQNAWKSGQSLAVHGWIYGIEDGILKDLNVCITSPDEIAKAEKMDYQFIQLD
jgi:carbonic anhydrase